MLPEEQYRDLAPELRRGRRRNGLTVLMQTAIRVLHEQHPRWGVVRLRRAIPGLPRNSATGYLKRLRRLGRRWRRRRLHRLEWLLPGAAWATDGTWLDRPVQSSGRRALVVVELHRRKTLRLQAVPGERAVAAEQVLTELFAQHGAPLVLKLDNGSAFTAKRFQWFCRRHGVTLLHSPIRTPRYNGTCEVSGKWAKRRAQAAAARRGSPEVLCQDDLDAAVTFTGTMPRIDPALRDRFQQCVAEELQLVAAQRGVALAASLQDHVRRSLERVAVRRALQLCHILTIKGREYRQWLPDSAA